MESLNVDKKTALVIELLGASAIPILDENPQYRYNRQSPRTSWSRSEYAFTREATPVVSADETTGGFLSLPWSPGHERNGYVFGRGEAGFAHVKLPAYLAKALSTAHFKIFLNRYKIWVVESLSSNGTMYRGMLLQSQQRALHPEEPNEIRIGDLQLLVHIPNPPSSLEYERGYECVSIGPSTSRSSASIASTSIWSQAAPQTVSSDICEYHVCQKQPIQPPHPNVHHIPLSNDLVERNTSGIFPETWSTKFAAIGIRDCRPYVVKYYTENDHEQRQFSTIAYLSRECQSIISYIDYIPDQRAIITDLVDGVSLESWLEHHVADPAWVSLIYGQLIDALSYLAKHNIIHRDIQPAKVIVSSSQVWLSGFSEFVETRSTKSWDGNSYYSAPEVGLGDLYDTRADVFSLSKLFARCFFPESLSPSDSGSQILEVDPETMSLVSTGLSTLAEERMFATQIKSRLTKLMGERLELPFERLGLTKTRHLARRNCDGQDWIRARDLLEAISPDSGHATDTKHFFRSRMMFEDEEYIPAKNAVKLCRKFNLNGFTSLIRKKQWTGTYKDRKDIFFHAPSRMFNISQLLALVGSAAILSIQAISPRDRQEVRGVKDWEGTYIDWNTFKTIAKILMKDYGITFDRRKNAPNEILSSRFLSNVAAENIILVTREFNHHMLMLRRKDCFVNWSPFSPVSEFVSTKESLLRCENLSLPELRRTILSLQSQPRTFDWPLPDLMVQPCYDSEATSVATTNSSDDEDDDRVRLR